MAEESESSSSFEDEPPPPVKTGFSIDLGSVERDKVDDARPVALPHTPRAEVLRAARAAVQQGARVASAQGTKMAGGDGLGDASNGARSVSFAPRFAASASSEPTPSSERRPRSAATRLRRIAHALVCPCRQRARPMPAETDAATPAPGHATDQDATKQYRWATRLEEVELLSRLGSGAFGEVWSGRWRRTAVAVKVQHGHFTPSDQRSFFREMQLLADLRHEHIVRFVGACVEQGRMAILFELCPNTLHQMLYDEPASPPAPAQLLRLLQQVALGVYYLHCFAPPVLHLDLKSANVLIDAHGVAKVCDFGMSRVLAAGGDSEGEGASRRPNEPAPTPPDLPPRPPSHSTQPALGSPQWAAPELLRGEECAEAADVYSFGILVYEAVARQLPYAGLTLDATIVGVVTGMLPRPALTEREREGWPPAVPALMGRCTVESPAARPPFSAVLDTLDEAVAASPPATPPATAAAPCSAPGQVTGVGARTSQMAVKVLSSSGAAIRARLHARRRAEHEVPEAPLPAMPITPMATQPLPQSGAGGGTGGGRPLSRENSARQMLRRRGSRFLAWSRPPSPDADGQVRPSWWLYA